MASSWTLTCSNAGSEYGYLDVSGDNNYCKEWEKINQDMVWNESPLAIPRKFEKSSGRKKLPKDYKKIGIVRGRIKPLSSQSSKDNLKLR